MKSYVIAYGGSRAGRVAVSPRPFSRLVPVARLSPPADPATQKGRTPAWVLLPEAAPFAAVLYGHGVPFEVFRRTGERVETGASPLLGDAAIATQTGLWLPDAEVLWSGARTAARQALRAIEMLRAGAWM